VPSMPKGTDPVAALRCRAVDSSLLMSFADTLVRWIVSPTGASMDRFSVRFTGHSFVSWIFARATHVPYNAPLLLTTIGSVTGKKRTVVLPHFQVESALCIVGSLGGAPRDPYWAKNLRANSEAWIRVDRQSHPVIARLAADSEREKLWTAITQLAPIYLDYAERADGHREIPVFVLASV